MAKLHANELDITTDLVLQLLKKQCPQWADSPLHPIASSGTDHALFRLGNDFVIRLPKIDWAAQGIHKECQWVPKLVSYLIVPISAPVFEGQADTTYPWPWMIVQWNDGINPAFENENEYAILAQDLAHFLNAFHAIPLVQGPQSRRGTPLKMLDEETRTAIHALQDDINVSQITTLWESFCTVPEWNQHPVWVHGDFLPGNILIEDNRLSAVIDFSDVGMGDPACDLVIAWSLLNKNSRQIFKDHLKNIDEDTWQRGRGRALSIALIILPYYKNTNPVLTALAKRMIEQVIEES